MSSASQTSIGTVGVAVLTTASADRQQDASSPLAHRDDPSRVPQRGPTILRATGIAKNYGGHHALEDVSIEVSTGEFVALVGPSGSGKSTLLKIIAGFEAPTQGRVEIDGLDMTRVAAAERPTSMVFQRLALWPHMTVAENIGFPLRLRRVPTAEIEQRIGSIMELMHLNPAYAARYPKQLSGGEQQRVALARAMIARPRILLLDEPLSALDAKLKKNLQAELRSLHRKLGVTFVHVTHDLEEAMILADSICVMRGGRIIQRGTPADIYYRPLTPFVATFIGETNLIPVRVTRKSGGTVNLSAERGLFSDVSIDAGQVAPGVRDSGLLLIRPEHLRPGTKLPGLPAFDATVTEIFVKGSVTQYRAEATVASVPIVFETQGERTPIASLGDRIPLSFAPGDGYVVQATD